MFAALADDGLSGALADVLDAGEPEADTAPMDTPAAPPKPALGRLLAWMGAEAPKLLASIIVLVLCAVFVPVAFMGGLAGQMYKQFAITIAVSVVLSGIVALTLTPALCALLLKEGHSHPNRFFVWFNNFFDRVTARYTAGVRFFLKRTGVGLLVFAGLIAITVGLFRAVLTLIRRCPQ